MSDVRSQQTNKSSNRNRIRICAHDGKAEGSNYIGHARAHHDGVFTEWVKEEPLLDQPWCTNWKEVIADKTIKPIGTLPKFQRGTGKQYSQKNSVRGSKQGSSIASQSHYQGDDDDVQMENIVQEEEKVQVAVSELGQLESNKILGKRSLAKLAEGLEQAVERKLLNQVVTDTPASNGPQSKRINPNLNFGANIPTQTENRTKISAKNLNNLPQASVEQKQQTPHYDQEFLAPLPLAHTVYVGQGERNQESIEKLKALNKNKTGSAIVQVPQLLKLASFFVEPLVSNFVEFEKLNLIHLKDLLLQAQEVANELSVENTVSIAFASFLFGGSVWTSLPRMFASLDVDKLDQVLSNFCSLLIGKFDQNLAKWVRCYWRFLDEQTLLLLRYLTENKVKNSLAFDIATISTVVKFRDVTEYLTVVEVFSQFSAFRMVLSSISACAPQWKSEYKLSFEDFGSLVQFLMKSENKQLIEAKEEELVDLSLRSWLERLTTAKAESQIVDVASIQFRLNQLQQLYGQLPKSYATNLCLSGDSRYMRTLHKVTNPPNALQFANAQYAAFYFKQTLKQTIKQLWCIPSGQGKSRTMATNALILLLASSTTKVHLVFDSKHLMERDQREFNQWYIFNNLESQVEFHVGSDFECQQGEIILVDEADELILANPARFAEKIQQHRCICLTATPDDDDSQGVEREVLKVLGFSRFNGQPTDPVASAKELKPKPEALAFAPGPELVSFIQKEIQERAVLCYCSSEFLQLLTNANLPVILMSDEETINDEFLRTLDNRTSPDGTHALIVALGSFGMRGFDYRSESKGITLILAASFPNQRQAMQGLNRVGRFGDKCKRYIAKDVSLIDQKEELKYLASLNQFLGQNQKAKVVAHLPREERKKATTTTNTAGSTPAVGKFKDSKQQRSSQTALIGVPQDQCITKRRTQLLDQTTSKRRKMKQ